MNCFVLGWTNLKCVNQRGIFSNDYMCIYCGGRVKKDNTIDLECSNDVLNGTTEDEIQVWLKDTKNVTAVEFCFNGSHTELVMSSCFCPPGESFRKVRSLSPLDQTSLSADFASFRIENELACSPMGHIFTYHINYMNHIIWCIIERMKSF